MVAGYFALEDPAPAGTGRPGAAGRGGARRAAACAATSTGSTSPPTGEVRVVDYKTGATAREAYEAKALFQLKFYALVLWRTRGTVPHQLRLMYLVGSRHADLPPDAAELERFERTLVAVWRAIERRSAPVTSGAKPEPALRVVRHQALCPAFGGTPRRGGLPGSRRRPPVRPGAAGPSRAAGPAGTAGAAGMPVRPGRRSAGVRRQVETASPTDAGCGPAARP